MKNRWHTYQTTIGRLAAIFVVLLLSISTTYDQSVKAQGSTVPATGGLLPFLHFTHLTSDDGLIQNSVEAILQDRQGFMWFGTQAGLSRYDGYRFTTFQHQYDDPNSLSESHVRSLFEDRDGMIWIGTEGGGVSKFDPLKQTFTNYQPTPGNTNTIGSDRILSIFQDSQNNLWFGGPPLGGLSRYNPATGRFTRYRGNGADASGPFQGGTSAGIVEPEPGHLWMIADYVLLEYDLHTETFTSYALPNKNEGRLAGILADSDGNVWFGGNLGLYKFSPSSKTFTLFDNTPQGINDLLIDNTGILWITARSGLYQFDRNAGKIMRRIGHNQDATNSLSSDHVTALYLDRAGEIWVGTSDQGLNVYDPRQARFAHFRSEPDNPNGLAKGPVSAISAVDAQHLWVGIGAVLSRVDLASGVITNFSPPPPQNGTQTISAVHQDRAGVVWVGVNAQVMTLDPTTGTFTEYPLNLPSGQPGGPSSPGQSPGGGSSPPGAPPVPFLPSRVVAIYEDAQNNLWIALNQQGVFRLDADRKDVRFFQAPLAPPAPPGTSINAPQPTPNGQPGSNGGGLVIIPPITNLFGDPSGNIWVSTINGFSKLNQATGKFERLRIRSGDGGADSAVQSLYEDQTGLLWLATEDGLIRFDQQTKAVQRFSDKDGLASSYVLGILGDNSGHLWISTNKGLSRFTLATGVFRNFDVSDGLQANEFSPNAFATAGDGRLFFGGVNGLTGFYPDAITDSADQPWVVLTDFQFPETAPAGDDSAFQTQPIWAAHNLTLGYNQNDFTFEFSGLNFVAPLNSRYRYRMDGYESSWTETKGARHFATYTNLPPGNYTFHVQTANSAGMWSAHETSLTLTIAAPWWETTLFQGLVAIGLAGLAYASYKWRIYTVRRRTRELEAEVAERTSALQQRTMQLQTSQEHLSHAKDAAEAASRAKSAFLANMSHELRSPLNAILGFAQVINRNQSLPHDVHENLDIVLRSGEHLLALINQVLDLSKIEVGHMSLNDVDFDLYRLLDDVEHMFRLKADSKALMLVFDRPSDVPQFLHGDEVKIRQILINLIGNALKFTRHGGVTLRVRRAAPATPAANTGPTELRFEVEDSGPGIAENEIEELFEPFAQTSTGRQSYEGTGLGLPISRKFVRMMGGDITVKSQVGIGTTICFNIFSMVIEGGMRAASPIRQRVTALEPGQPHYRILVVDDRATNRQLIVKLLEPLGFDLREADNGQKAVEVSQVFEPHLIWMDLRMPVMDGLEATRRIRAAKVNSAPVIVALTASALEEDRTAILAAGCSDIVRKPFRTDTIFETLATHLGVHYSYATDTEPAAAPGDREKLAFDKLKTAIGKLPGVLTERLAEGIELGDMAMIGAAIAEIRQIDPLLADALNDMAYQFEYDKILGLV